MRVSAQADDDDRAGRSRPQLRIRLLGEPDVQVGDRRPAPLPSARAGSLLGYLLLHGDAPHSRQRLAFLLWPDSTGAQARTNLRKVLHTLRHEAPDIDRHLEVTTRSVRWRWDAPAWIDVVAFDVALTDAERPGAAAAAVVDALRRAVPLYRGDLLVGCDDEWLVDERVRLRDRYVSALRRLAQALDERGEHAEAIRVGRDLLRWEPLREDGYQLLMDLHAAAGDRAGALRVYHQCVATLQRELGVDPSEATQAARAAVVAGAPPATSGTTARAARSEPAMPGPALPEAAVVGSGAAVAGMSGPVAVRRDGSGAPAGGAPVPGIVGRAAEWRRLTELWERVGAGEPHLALVTGEPGIGKTRLVEELARWCDRRGGAVATARSYATEGDLGYGVVIAWLRSRSVAEHLRTRSVVERAALARLLPELDTDPARAVEALDASDQRRRLFDAVVGALAASAGPLLLVADDAQWADAQSLALTHHLVRATPGNPTLVVATVRREDLDVGHPVTAILADLQTIDRATEVALPRLTRAETAALAIRLGAGPDTGHDPDAVYADTEGNPLFVVETVRAAREGGGERPGLTPKLQAVIGARLARCGEPAGTVLGTAATVGRSFTADLVRRASGLDDTAFVRGLDELWRRGLVREHGADAYDFTHGSIREVAYGGLSPATRRRNHRLVAEVLQTLHPDGVDAVSGQVAHHYERAGQPNDAVGWYLRAAVEAQRRYASGEAVELLERARALVPALPGPRLGSAELAIVSALPTALVGVDGFASDRVAEAQSRALELADALGAEPPPPLLRSLVMSRLCRHDFDGARAAAGRLRAAAERTGDDGLLVESGYLLGIAAFWAGRPGTARVHFEHVVERYRAEWRSEHLVRFGHDPAVVCLSRLGNTLWFLDRPDDAWRVRDAAVALADEVGHPYTRGTAHGFAALLSLDLADERGVRTHTAALADVTHHTRPTGAFADALAGYLEVLDGRAGRGTDRIRAAIAAAGPVDPAPGVHACLRRILVAAHDAAGDAEGGRRAADEALRVSGSRLWEAEIRRLRAGFLAATGAPAGDVGAELARAAAAAHRQGAAGPGRRLEETRARLRPPR